MLKGNRSCYGLIVSGRAQDGRTSDALEFIIYDVIKISLLLSDVVFAVP